MGLSAEEVSAVIVTRGDVDLEPILETLPYPEVIVWNDRERGSQGCYGRWLAMEEACNDVVYFQDDDIVFTEHDSLLAAYEGPDCFVSNMPSPWYEMTGYEKLHSCLVGAGSLVPKGLAQPAFDSYLAEWPKDELFLTYCDQINGILTPSRRYDFGYTILPHASAPGRIYTTPDADIRKWTVIRRALFLRDGI